MIDRIQILVVNLAPRESNCAICGCDLVDARQGVPMFEGCAVPNNWQGEWGGCDACPRCFDLHAQGRIPMWPNPPTTSARS